MKFTFKPPYTIVSDDPEIYVIIAGSQREEGQHFVLHLNDEEIGFGTASYVGDDQTERLADGTKVWRIGEVGCSVLRMRREHTDMDININARPCRFRNEDELKRAMDIFAQALSTFSGLIDRDRFIQGKVQEVGHPYADDQGKVIVEYTDAVLEKVKDGSYLV